MDYGVAFLKEQERHNCWNEYKDDKTKNWVEFGKDSEEAFELDNLARQKLDLCLDKVKEKYKSWNIEIFSLYIFILIYQQEFLNSKT